MDRNRKEVLGVCRLCEGYGPLEQSHIIPRAAYRRILKGSHGETPDHQFVRVTADVSVRTNEQITERLLCPVHEDRFGKWESYSFPVLSQGDGVFPWLAATAPIFGSLSDSSAVNVTKLSLFAASIFWRLSVSAAFARLYNLGPYEADFRKYLLVDGAPFPEHARLVIYLLDHTDATCPVDRSFATFPGSRQPGCRLHRFVILGVDMWLFVGSHFPRHVDKSCFFRTGWVMVRPADAFAQRIAPMLANAASKGARVRAQQRTPRAPSS